LSLTKLDRKVTKVAKIFLFFPVWNERTEKNNRPCGIATIYRYRFVLLTLAIAVPTVCKHLYGICRYDLLKIAFLGALGVLSEAGGKYAFTLENT